MSRLNYHHLNYFWQVAKEGNLTKAAANLHVSQSALSSQIMQLESTMGVTLFLREGRKLVLTEIGRQTFLYADDIFSKGQELESLLTKGIKPESVTIRIGMLSTMSRNFIEHFIEPLLKKQSAKYVISARGQTNLLNSLSTHQFDLALTNIEVRGTEKQLWQCQLLARQPVAIVGPPKMGLGKKFSDKYKSQPWVLPVSESPIRTSFDSFCSLHQFQPNVIAEADDMAMLRLLARDSGAIAVIPEVVVKDELKQGKLVSYLTLPNVYENFYAVTIKRQYTHSLVNELINNAINLIDPEMHSSSP